MNSCPHKIGSALVLYFALLNGAKKDPGFNEAIRGVAICQEPEDESFYLYGCSERWASITDTWHRSVEEAMSQARFQHGNALGKWVAAQQVVQRGGHASSVP